MTDYRTMLDKPYLGAWDLPTDRDAIVRIDKVEAATVNNGSKTNRKPLLHLTSAKGVQLKPMICNSTNAKTIASMYGTHVEQWTGQYIALYIAQTNSPSGGGLVDAIRVRPTKPEPKRTAKEPINAES